MTQINAEVVASEAILLKTSLSTSSSTKSSATNSSTESSATELAESNNIISTKMKLNSTENDERNLDVDISSTHQHQDYFVEMSSREMAIDCPEGFIPENKTKPAYPVVVVADDFSPSQLNKNMLIKPLLNILLKSTKMTGIKNLHNHYTHNHSQHQEKQKMQTTIELAMEEASCIQSSTRNNQEEDLDESSLGETSHRNGGGNDGNVGGGEVNNCFVMDSSPSSSIENSKVVKRLDEKSTSSSLLNQQHQQQLMLSSPSSASSTSLIKAEFINNLNTETNMSSPEFSKNIVIKSVEINEATVISMSNGEAAAPVVVGELDLERMIVASLNNNNGAMIKKSNVEIMTSVVKSKNLHDEKYEKKSVEIIGLEDIDLSNGPKSEKINNNDVNVYISNFLTESKQDDEPLRIQETKIDEILNNLDYSKHKQSTNSIENNQLVNNSFLNLPKKNSSQKNGDNKNDDEDEDEDERKREDSKYEHDDEDEKMLTDEGRFLLKKAEYYCVENLKLVNIEKPDAPLGATIKSRDGSILISRIVIGGAAQKSGLLHENDEILEVNSIPVRGKTINDICDMLYNMQGIISFLIIPKIVTDDETEPELEEKKKLKMNSGLNLHLRALFNYSPRDDLYIPCKELGLEFSKGDILHVISQSDNDWWQAYKDDDKDNSLARLIPSKVFQERRFSQMKAIIGDSFITRKKREKGFCVKGFHGNRRRQALFGMNEPNLDEIVTYEEVTLFKPPPNRKRPIVLIGPHNIGRHELRKRLMQTSPSLFEVAIPHTTRTPRRDEIDGKDYHFLPRHIFEADIKQNRFIEHGEYEKNLYGTSREAIKKVIENSKICVLNLYPQALKALRCSDLMPFVIYIGPPNLVKLKELKTKTNEAYRENDLLDIIDKGREIEEIYGHYFDKIIRNMDMDKTYKELFETIEKVQNEENWIPMSWLTK